jgi:hypothetical protein
MNGRDVESVLDANEHASLCDALDRVLNKGAVVVGDLTISVADIDLIYLGLQLVLTSVETGRRLHADHWSTARIQNAPARVYDVVGWDEA